MTGNPKPGHRIRWAVAIAVVLWLAPSTVSTGRIAGEPLHVDSPLFGVGTPREDARRLRANDRRCCEPIQARPHPRGALN